MEEYKKEESNELNNTKEQLDNTVLNKPNHSFNDTTKNTTSKKITDNLNSNNSLLFFRIRTIIGILPCLFIDIKSPYLFNFVGDPLTLFFDAGIVTKITLLFKLILLLSRMVI